VKLDRGIVAGIDSDPARQAFVAGMRHFSVTTGCGMIAEGIETDGELRTLLDLGITLGQGYLLGMPRPAR
jgi:EAL domain-containing protein (putative c-di-GMP-specific phosphodiesterase class I)